MKSASTNAVIHLVACLAAGASQSTSWPRTAIASLFVQRWAGPPQPGLSGRGTESSLPSRSSSRDVCTPGTRSWWYVPGWRSFAFSISNGSTHKVEVDPQTFSLNELSPKQTPLRYHIPAGEILDKALTANTLTPGQHTLGAVFFERDKKAREVVLRIPLSGMTFDVPLTIR